MPLDKVPCLYCQTENECQIEDNDQLEDNDQKQPSLGNCHNCGMPLAKKHPNNKKDKLNLFVKWFIFIVIFCVAMVIYLPR
jgi:hypothetical protein